MTTTTPERTDAGLGLVELMVAMLVLTVALLTPVPVQTRALGGVVRAEERQRATGYANQVLERVRARTDVTVGFDALAVLGQPLEPLPVAGVTKVEVPS